MKFSYTVISASIALCLGLILLCGIIDSTESAIITKGGSPVAILTDGPVRGKISKSRNARDFYSFRGIQYAKAERFQVAEPIHWWTEIRDALDFGSICPQVGLDDGTIVDSSEDCLFINVYVPVLSSEVLNAKPKKTNKLLLPVMFWIHGGGFMDGAGSFMGPDYFMDEDAILVTFNYRLGALGFMNTADGIIPGNLGLKDMVSALKWVQKNIHGFNGDPEEVTIFGESAGGNAVHLLMLSPATKGLFRGAISQSGTGLTPWSIAMNPVKWLKTVSENVGCTEEKSADIVKCLHSKNTDVILKAQKTITHGSDNIEIAFAPCIETNLPRFRSQKSDFVFLPASPYELIVNDYHKNSRDIPFIVGGNEIEGLLVFALGTIYGEGKMQSLNDNWLSQTSKTFAYGSYVPSENLEEFSKELRSIYYGEESITRDNKDILIRLHSDLNFLRGIALAADLHSKTNSQVYPYILKYRGEFSIVNLMGAPTQGVSHADDLQYLFPSLKAPQNWPDLKPNTSDEEFSKKLVSLWASFAINGKPTTSWGDEWKPVANEQYGSQLKKISWLHLDTNPALVQETEENWERLNKVDTLFSKYERPQVSWRAGSDLPPSSVPERNEL